MKADKKDIFKKVIKLGADDQPVANFTDTVMQTIEAEVEREIALKALLQQQPAEGPSFSFTANVMAQISTKPLSVTYKPIITKKAWYAIIAIAMVFLLLIGLSNSPQTNTADQNKLAAVLKTINALPPLYLIGIIIAGGLLFADYLITQRKTKLDMI
ncbi:MAG: hypothetical protein V4560_08560 [Bacteroidota bacterium]